MKIFHLVPQPELYESGNQTYAEVNWQILQVSFFSNEKSVLLLPCPALSSLAIMPKENKASANVKLHLAE